MVKQRCGYFDLNTVVFRGGCLTGPNHAGTEMHGFLSYLMKCTIEKRPYTIFGYKGKQVRDNIHSLDLIRMFDAYYSSPLPGGKVYNAGGGRFSNASMLESIELCEQISGNKLSYEYSEVNRKGDHIWYISDLSKFCADFPEWRQEYNVSAILEEIHDFETNL